MSRHATLPTSKEKPTCCFDAAESVDHGVVHPVVAAGVLELQTRDLSVGPTPAVKPSPGRRTRRGFEERYLVEEAEHGHALRVGQSRGQVGVVVLHVDDV